MKVTIVGSGYVGLVTGTCFSEVGIDVTCVDTDKQKIDNLNNGILPLTFVDAADYEALDPMDDLVLEHAPDQVRQAAKGADVILWNRTKGTSLRTRLSISERQSDILLAGGLLNYTRGEG